MKYFVPLILLSLLSCASDTEEKSITLADLVKGERAQVVAIEIPDELKADSAFHARFIYGMKIKPGVVLTARGPEERERGTIYGFDTEGGDYAGLYQPHAGMIRVKKNDQ